MTLTLSAGQPALSQIERVALRPFVTPLAPRSDRQFESRAFRLVVPLSALQGAHLLLPPPPNGFAALAAATVAGLLVVGAVLQLAQDSIFEHQSLEQTEGTLQAALPDGDFQGPMPGCRTPRRSVASPIISVSEAHTSPFVKRQRATKKTNATRSGPRGVILDDATV
jgi:hypothetical protein